MYNDDVGLRLHPGSVPSLLLWCPQYVWMTTGPSM